LSDTADDRPSTSQQESTTTAETPQETSSSTPEKTPPALDISTDSIFLPILHATKEKHAMACYVALMMGTPGHK